MAAFTATLMQTGPPGPQGPPGPPGGVTAQNVATASRAAGVVYQNTSGKAMYVAISWDLSAKSCELSFRTDAANPPVTEVARVADTSPSGTVLKQIVAVVLAGNYYECAVLTGTPVLVAWVEYT